MYIWRFPGELVEPHLVPCRRKAKTIEDEAHGTAGRHTTSNFKADWQISHQRGQVFLQMIYCNRGIQCYLSVARSTFLPDLNCVYFGAAARPKMRAENDSIEPWRWPFRGTGFVGTGVHTWLDVFRGLGLDRRHSPEGSALRS